ncbi:hypothetical protein [Pseudoalteromonas denitrificans]|jgi:hypothetical protein|uniref:Uncharacterized protein n=1 Tax=Pseudoalteromonas denitrificans DSM 6059 TaxID=1123010 RepID=A0A1I1DST6_9GAMM|nr:hypothetical protein [Pseudoalteromonas denitrificans]SFB77961.1 hypothetical protein SAMN02745724_00040 [Pseudoalteromonas denitrificans DSM 6059]
MQISNELLTDVSASQETNKQIIDMLGLKHDGDIQFHVYQTQVDDKEIYCCLSGGLVENNEIVFTPVGLGAFEALTNVKVTEDNYYAEELKVENGSIQQQIEAVFNKVPAESKVCFIGDMTGTLKSSISKVFPLALN